MLIHLHRPADNDCFDEGRTRARMLGEVATDMYPGASWQAVETHVANDWHAVRGTSPLTDVGEQDITIDLPLDYVVRSAARAGFRHQRSLTQAEWLRELGVEQLVDEARRAWDEQAHVGDLAALRHRSRVSEASALLDPAGLGAHQVLVFTK